MKKLTSILMAVLLVLGLALPAAAQEAVEEAPPQILDAKVITYVTDEARTVAGVRLEYDQDIATGTYGLDSYFVNGYDLVAVYVSASGEWKDAAKTGRYVFAEFAISQTPGYYEGKANFWTTDNAYLDMTLDIFCETDNCWFTTSGCIHFEMEDYIAGSFTGETGVETPYQFYIPEGYEAADEALADLPLVIWLHGGGESGTDNTEPLLANRGALNFSSREAQAEHPCFVLAPQTNMGWRDDAIVNLHSIVLSLIEQYNVDPSRIYSIGCSMGGMGTRTLAQTYPDMLAAAVPIANNAYADMPDEERGLYEGLPMLYITSADDPVFTRADEEDPEKGTIEGQMIQAMEVFESLGMTTYAAIGDDALNGYLRGALAEMELQEVLNAAAEAQADKIFVTYLAGTVLPAPHSSWMPATANAALRDWMFAQVNDQPFAG